MKDPLIRTTREAAASRWTGPPGEGVLQPVKARVSASRVGVTVLSRATASASGTSSISVPRSATI